MPDEKEQKDLLAELEKNDVKVDKKAAESMKEKIMKENTGQKWLGLGVHEVFIQDVELVQAKTGTMGMKFIVENDDGKGEVSMWLSEAALPYTIENVSRLIVHNVPEDKKSAVKVAMSNVVSAKELFSIAKEKMIQYQCWLSVREAKNGATYTDKNGEEKPSLERTLLPYKPNETPVQAVASVMGNVEVLNDDPVNLNNLPF